ncbi:MAG TPA: YjgN family protein [Burkholderiales bacterium]|nr:YjgN family protein [Burkholderiales bacterium]
MDTQQVQPARPAGSAVPGGGRYPLEFTATAGEYFRIWIVNLALSVITLGIYSAWAKVRKQRYFYGHTRIDGQGFEYSGNPVAILKGRIIAAAVIAVYYGVGHYAPTYQLLLWIPLAIFGPWLLVRSLAFNAYNTAWRGVRLHFDGTYGGCLKVVLTHGWFVLFGITYPYFKHKLMRFIAENHRFGTTHFEVADFKKPFISAYAHAYGFALLLILGLSAVGFAIGAMGASQGKAGGGKVLALLVPGLAVFYGGMFLLFAYIRARTINALWKAIKIGPVRFASALRARDLMWLYFSNLVAVALTLGFATPWAVVRTMRYRASKTMVVAAGPLDGFLQAEAQQVSVAGEEVADFFGIDIGF